MQPPSYDEFIKDGPLETVVKKTENEQFLINLCPTPGCRCSHVRPVHRNGTIIGFSCSNGCNYRVKRDFATGEISYYELLSFNHYRVDSSINGYRVSRTGLPDMDWH